MKRMELTICSGKDAPDFGRNIVSNVDGLISKTTYPQYSKAISDEIALMVQSEMEKGRTQWLQLTVEIDDIPLFFWLPNELELICQVFARKPFPTAKTLARESPNELRLNTHWLSKLPKEVKAPKYRERFIKYVESSPQELREFYAFYDSTSA